MSVYLDKFRTVIPAYQRRKLSELLIEKRQKGTLNSLEELKAELVKLTDEFLYKIIGIR